MKSKVYQQFTSSFWNYLNGDPTLTANIKYTGPEQILPSVFDVTAFATTTIGAANLAMAELKSLRTHSANFCQVEVDTIEASAAFKSDSLFKPIGWDLPSPWDAFAGDYQCSNFWIRLHTNYSYHRDAVFKVIGNATDRRELAKNIINWDAIKLEQAIVDAGGCCALMYDKETWIHHPQGLASLDEAPIKLTPLRNAKATFEQIAAEDLPLKGIRVLDLTRVIAGPVCTKFLSAHGAQVLRIDPPHFQEVMALLPETTVGKKRAFLDLTSIEGRNTFEKLLKESHVFVHGLRPDALEKLGINLDYIAQINPQLIVATLNAYGWNGPWKWRRGFDSLVQMSCGIAAAGAQYKKSAKPIPLPVQALDHGIGYLLAAGVCRSLSEIYRDNKVNTINASLIGAANSLQQYPGDFEIDAPSNSRFSPNLIEENTFWGPALRVRCPGTINGKHAQWIIPAGPLGQDAPHF
ncbi:MAG: CoA transferase [Bacteriovorax sp.]|nr:CoA transferase [Bacteriovorax sp.]